jgi:drug/metabolite transporter (DMT)-like permease
VVQSRFNTIFLAVIACLLWSSAFAGVKIGLQYETPLQFAGIRFFIAGWLVLPLAFRNNPNYFSIFQAQWKMILLIAFMQTFLQYALFYTGINLIPGAVGAIVIGSQPLFISMVAHFIMPGDRMTLNRLLIIFLGIIGVVLVTLSRDPASLAARIAVTGVLLLITINILSGFTNVFIARDRGKIPPLVLSSSSMILGGGGLYLTSLIFEPADTGPKPLVYYGSLAWLSLLSAIAISIWTVLLKRPGIVVSELNFWKFLIPLFGAILSWILLPEEKPQVLTILGMVIIAGSLILLNLVQRKNRMYLKEKN